MRYKDFHRSVRTVRRFDSSECAVEQPNCSLREVVDAMLTGKPVNNNLRTHTPLPPDGEDEEDFEFGTREINDLVDLQQLSDEIEAKTAEQVKAQAEETANAEREAFEKAVNDEIAKRTELS